MGFSSVDSTEDGKYLEEGHISVLNMNRLPCLALLPEKLSVTTVCTLAILY